MGESNRKRQGALIQGAGQADQLQVVDTPGGRLYVGIHVGWDAGAAATPHGQPVFFAEFLAATGVFERAVSACPLAHRSGNAPDKRDVLCTLMLGLLAIHRPYTRITALPGDAVVAQALGMTKVISEDALLRALERIDEPTGPRARAAQPRAAHFLGGQPAPGAGRAGELGQAARRPARQGRAN